MVKMRTNVKVEQATTTEEVVQEETQVQEVVDQEVTEAPVTEVIDEVQEEQTTESVSEEVTEEQETQESAPQVIEQPVAEPATEAPVEQVTEDVSGPKSILEQALVSKYPTLNIFAHVFSDYLEHMAKGKPVDPANGVRLQFRLWSAFRTLINNTEQGIFREVWKQVLAICLESKDKVFNEFYMYRFADQWTQQKDQLRAFHALVNLIIITADPISRRAALAQVDLDKTIGSAYGTTGRNNLVLFYKS